MKHLFFSFALSVATASAGIAPPKVTVRLFGWLFPFWEIGTPNDVTTRGGEASFSKSQLNSFGPQIIRIRYISILISRLASMPALTALVASVDWNLSLNGLVLDPLVALMLR